MTTNADLARRCFRAYQDSDRDALEALVATDFTFTSPYDDAIDREMYFERCWPNHETTRAIDIEDAIEDGDRVVVRYVVETVTGKRFRNVEMLTFRGGKLAGADVYFGRTLDEGGG